MSKQYKIVTPHGTSEYTARQYIDAKVAIDRYISVVGVDKVTDTFDVYTYLRDVAVSTREFAEACEMGYAAWVFKRELTHKKIRVLHGSSVGNYVWVWVKK